MVELQTTREREIDAAYKPLPIGTRQRPWPTRQRGEENGVRTFGMGVIQSDVDPLWLYSARDYKHVLPELMRKMPVPGMFDAFETILNNPLVYLESDPGFGKSYLADLIGNAMHPEGAIIYDAGGKNLESLLFETIFDSNANSDLMDRINSALRDGTITAPSLKALRELKVTTVDSSGLKRKQPLLSEEGKKRLFDWKGLENSSISRKEIDDVLSSVQKYQEWNGGLRIGFKDVDGALIVSVNAENKPSINSPEKSLLWAINLTYLAQKDGSGFYNSALWKQFASRDGVAQIEKERLAFYAATTGLNKDTRIKWGELGSSFYFNPPENHINLDLILGLGVGFDVARAVAFHEIGHSQITKGFGQKIAELDEQIERLNSKGKDSSLTQDEYKQLY